MKPLHLHSVEHIDKLVWPQETGVSLKTSALSIFTDFSVHKPLIIESKVKAVDLEQLMKKAHVRLKIVVDENRKFLGVISLSDLSEEKILRKVDRSTKREDLLVEEFMHPRDKLKCFDYKELTRASVGDVLETQRSNHQQHCLVVDKSNHEIRGLISARDVARLLKGAVDIEQHISFEELFDEIYA
uniref:CBS domain-containing protein n=1 Tax=Ningiella ruwaisensis TaxID=2364274 RepID=UPI00109F5155|nr:CBS domain-containing protein [Ningiella ruwaisensis]